MCKNLNPKKQKELVNKALIKFKNHPKSSIPISVYLISAKWWRKWAEYVDYNGNILET